MHYKKLLDPTDFIGPQDFEEPKTVTISRVVRELDEDKKGFRAMYFKANGKELARKYKVPNTVYYGLSVHLGTDVDAWAEKEITLYATTCLAFGDVEPCVRVQFPTEVEAKIMKYMKKRKVNPKVYRIKE